MSVSTGPGATTLTVMLRDAELAGQRAGEADEAGLRRGVVRLAGRAEQPDDRRHEDDATLAGPQHALARPAWRRGRPPVRLASITDVKSSSLIRSSRPSLVMPAFETSTSTGP